MDKSLYLTFGSGFGVVQVCVVSVDSANESFLFEVFELLPDWSSSTIPFVTKTKIVTVTTNDTVSKKLQKQQHLSLLDQYDTQRSDITVDETGEGVVEDVVMGDVVIVASGIFFVFKST